MAAIVSKPRLQLDSTERTQTEPTIFVMVCYVSLINERYSTRTCRILSNNEVFVAFHYAPMSLTADRLQSTSMGCSMHKMLSKHERTSRQFVIQFPESCLILPAWFFEPGKRGKMRKKWFIRRWLEKRGATIHQSIPSSLLIHVSARWKCAWQVKEDQGTHHGKYAILRLYSTFFHLLLVDAEGELLEIFSISNLVGR